MARQQVVIESSVRINGLAEVRQHAVVWSDSWGYIVNPADGVRSGRARGLVTAEHVQAVLERAGHRLEARSLDALFDLDEVVRLTTPPAFVVREPVRGLVVVSTGTGRVVGEPVVPRSTLQVTLRLAARVLQAVAPVGFRSLTDRGLAGDAAADLVAFGRALERVWRRNGIGVRPLQDWVTARTSGDRSAMAAAEAALTAGPVLDARVVAAVVASLDGRSTAGRVPDRRERPVSRPMLGLDALSR